MTQAPQYVINTKMIMKTTNHNTTGTNQRKSTSPTPALCGEAPPRRPDVTGYALHLLAAAFVTLLVLGVLALSIAAVPKWDGKWGLVMFSMLGMSVCWTSICWEALAGELAYRAYYRRWASNRLGEISRLVNQYDSEVK